ncbi:inactive ubiquitin thioesterase OTULINL isoform X2 [Ambystoma mexicanum]|uniref:inactive ubiquitin thioesterase OTULINL isoform X2 n=1 Tax=Ambystoma mexicanum TaxID=8296 RepID=UPI0037E8CDC1
MAGEKQEGQSWMAHITLAVNILWRKINPPLMLAMSYLVSTLWCCKERLLTWWMAYCQEKFKGNLSVADDVAVFSYCAQEWKGETVQAKRMRKAYEALFRRHHVKCIRQVRGDNYCAIRAVLFQVFRKGLSFPSWMKEKDILKIPERLLFSQGCNWIQQFSFGPERYAGPSVFVKLRKSIDALKNQWSEINSTKDQVERDELCRTLFSDEDKEYKLYEAVKFLLLYLVMEAHETMMNGQALPSFFGILFARDTSADPLSFMINHLNPVGDTGGLEQVDMFLLGYALEVKIRVFRLFKIDTGEFQAYYPDEYPREWHEVSLVTEDDRHYNIPIFKDK